MIKAETLLGGVRILDDLIGFSVRHMGNGRDNDLRFLIRENGAICASERREARLAAMP